MKRNRNRTGYRRVPMNKEMIGILDEQRERFKQAGRGLARCLEGFRHYCRPRCFSTLARRHFAGAFRQ